MERKILLVGTFSTDRMNRHEVEFSYSLKNDFGFKVIEYDYREEIRLHGTHSTSYNIVKLMRLHNPSLVLICSGKGLNINVLNEIYDFLPDIKIFNWFHDYDLTEDPIKHFQRMSRVCDKTFWTVRSEEHKQIYRDRNGDSFTWLHTPPHKDFYFPIDCEKDIDVLFCGTPHTHRNQLLSYLLENGVNIQIYGNESGSFKWYDKLKPFVKPAVFNKNYNELLNRAKIILNPIGEPNVEGCFSDRYFYPLAIRGVGLNEEGRGVSEIFSPGIDTISWMEYHNCLRKIKWLLEKPEVREQISNNGYRLFNEKYNLTKILEEMLSYANLA